jgi:hypothetical protein
MASILTVPFARTAAVSESIPDAREPARPKGPYLIIAAFWQDEDNTDAVAEAVRMAKFPRVPGYSNGAVVAFRCEVADSFEFRRDLERFDLAELNERPA